MHAVVLVSATEILVCRTNHKSRMHQLPNEILELIFVHLSIEDLLLSVALVCTKWRDLVQNVNVLPWKKACHRFIRRLPLEKNSTHPGTFLDLINDPVAIKQFAFTNKEVLTELIYLPEKKHLSYLCHLHFRSIRMWS